MLPAREARNDVPAFHKARPHMVPETTGTTPSMFAWRLRQSRVTSTRSRYVCLIDGPAGNVATGGYAYRDWFDLGSADVVLGVAPLFPVTGLTGHIAATIAAAAP